ncbi:hypothetical protein [Furfurilactobacillus entadae]|uniref:hypothetical protein n=1 Tax=Furfurilactobacillus entadae TaxID=2922307 RepID=UPI0035E56618
MNILATIGTVLLFVLIIVIQQLPKHVSADVIKRLEFSNNRQLQVEQYFRQIGGDELQSVLNDWTEYITKMDEKNKELGTDKGRQNFIDLTHKTLLYGSKKTVVLLSLLNQYNYKGQGDGGAKFMIYMANLIASLKYDFTGYEMNPLDLLMTKITDYDEEKAHYEKWNDEVKKEVEDGLN